MRGDDDLVARSIPKKAKIIEFICAEEGVASRTRNWSDVRLNLWRYPKISTSEPLVAPIAFCAFDAFFVSLVTLRESPRREGQSLV
jgi:hypothetical protein